MGIPVPGWQQPPFVAVATQVFIGLTALPDVLFQIQYATDPGSPSPWDNRVAWVGMAVATFMAWLWSARVRSAARGRHRRASAWAFGAWLVPGINLVWPYQLVADVWQAAGFGRPTIVRWWWATFLVGFVLGPVVLWNLPLRWPVLLGAVAEAVAAVLAVVIVRRVSAELSRWLPNT